MDGTQPLLVIPPCVFIESRNYYIVFDAGNGIYKLDEYIKSKTKPIYLFISHFHLDHISGLHTLAKFDFPQGINVYVGKGRKDDFYNIVNMPYTVSNKRKDENIFNLKTDVRLHELVDGIQRIPFEVSSIKMFHAYEDHGFRLNLDGKIISYSGDTGICDNSTELAKGAGILIHECSYKKYNENGKIWGHVGPAEAARLANDSGTKRLILTHFDASVYTTLGDRKEAEEKAKKIFPNTSVAVDDMIINL